MSDPTPGAARGAIRAVLGVGLLTGIGLLGWGLTPAPAAPVPDRTFDLRTPAAAPSTPTVAGVATATNAAASRTPTNPVLEPARMQIPDIGADAPVRAQTVTAQGDLVVPGDVSSVGSWSAGEGNDPRGVTVLAGHVDLDGDLGELHDLAAIAPGARVVLTDGRGRRETWSVDALEVRHKDDLPEFPADGPRRLAIVTCGGPVVHTAHGRGYRDNVIAWASPVG